MAFTVFIDDLALIEILIAMVAVLFAYAGVLIWWGMRQNDAKGVRTVLKGMSVPLGMTGFAIFGLALWGEMTWPFLASDGLGGYNIFFFDPLLLFGIVLVAYAISAHLSIKMEYVGLIALVFGAVTIFYGWQGYTATPAFTKDPFDTLLLYIAFGVTGIAAFPVTVLIDYFLKCADLGRPAFNPLIMGRAARPVRSITTTRGAQPVAPSVARSAPSTEEANTNLVSRFPIWAQTLVLFFPFVAALAAIAAFWYFDMTLPGHLGLGAAAAP